MKTHLVKRGDTLWDLAQHYYGDPLKWRMIWQANKTMMVNHYSRNSYMHGHWIFPGQKLNIPAPKPKPVFNMTKPVKPSPSSPSSPPKKDQFYAPQPPVHPGEKPQFNYEKQKEVTKYEYHYGIKNIAIEYSQYTRRAMFISKPMVIPGNVMEVSLHSSEEHPLFDELNGRAANRQTSVEYSIAYKENPSENDWHPILPQGTTRIQSERLFFQTSRTAKLRFTAQVYGLPEPRLFEDGKRVPRKDWTISDGGKTFQLLKTKKPGAIYTIDYTPNEEKENPWLVDIQHQGIETVKRIDTFPEGTARNKSVKLSKYPYIDYEKIAQTESFDPNLSDYKPIKVRLKNASIAGQGQTTLKRIEPYQQDENQPAFTRNKTDYENTRRVSMAPYSLKSEGEYSGFDYRQEGQKIFFTETFNRSQIIDNMERNHGNAEIEVEYEHLVSHFRLKIVLRRNGMNTETVTPVVNEYRLKFKVMK